MKKNIVQAKIEDLDGISNIFKKLDWDMYKSSNKNIIKYYIEKGSIFVIKENNKIVAAINIKIEGGAMEIISICSNVKGGGTTLIKFCENICKNKKIHKIWCWSASFLNATGFYDKMKFDEKFLLKKQCYGEDFWILGKTINI